MCQGGESTNALASLGRPSTAGVAAHRRPAEHRSGRHGIGRPRPLPLWSGRSPRPTRTGAVGSDLQPAQAPRRLRGPIDGAEDPEQAAAPVEWRNGRPRRARRRDVDRQPAHPRILPQPRLVHRPHDRCCLGGSSLSTSWSRLTTSPARRVYVHPLSGPSMQCIVDGLERAFGSVGRPKHLISDRGSGFDSAEMTDFLRSRSVKPPVRRNRQTWQHRRHRAGQSHLKG